MNSVHIWDVRIKETPYAYECQASVKVDGKTFSFSLLVPPGTWAKIETGFGRRFGASEVRQLFEARIKQYIENGNLQDIPTGLKIALRCLHELEVDGLFSDIRRENLLSLCSHFAPAEIPFLPNICAGMPDSSAAAGK